MKKIYLYIALGILIVIIFIGAFWFLKISQKNKVINTTSPSSSQIPSPATSNTTNSKINIYMIAENDGGKSGKLIGCGDSVVAAVREIKPTEAVLTAAYQELLSQKSRAYGESGLVNSLSESNLTLESASVKDGKATINLTGNIIVAGVCDNPRIEAQLNETALQFPTVQQVEIFVSGKNLKDILSQK